MTPHSLLSGSARGFRPFSGSQRGRAAAPSTPRDAQPPHFRPSAAARSPSPSRPPTSPSRHPSPSPTTSLRAVSNPSPLSNDLSSMLSSSSSSQATITIGGCETLILQTPSTSNPDSGLPLSLISALEGLSVGRQHPADLDCMDDLAPTTAPDLCLQLTAEDKLRLQQAMQGHSPLHTDDEDLSLDHPDHPDHASSTAQHSATIPSPLDPTQPIPTSQGLDHEAPAPMLQQRPSSSPRSSSSAASKPGSVADANADRIKSLVTRILKKAPPKPATVTTTPDPSQATTSANLDPLPAAPPSKRQLRTPSAPSAAAKAAVKKKGGKAGALAAALPRQQQEEIQAVLAKHCLPKDVAAAVSDAVASKQIYSNPEALDRLLTRVLKLTPGIQMKLVHAVLKQNPAVLKQSNVVLLHKWQALKTTLGCSDTQLLTMLDSKASSRNLMGLRVETIESKLQSLANVLHLSSAQVSALVRRRPHLLSCNAETLASKFTSMEQLLHCSHAEVVRIVLEAPEVLYSSPEGMEAKVQELCSAMGLSAAQIGKMASSKPRLLTSNTAALKARWQALKKVTGSCSRWSKELGSLAPSTLAALVLASSMKISRLEFLGTVRRAGISALSSIMNMTQVEFSAKFPKFDKWAEGQALAAAAAADADEA